MTPLFLCQLWVFDRGTTDLEVRFVLSRDPLKNIPTPPSRTVEWVHGTTRYFVAYWHKPQGGMTDDQIRQFAQTGHYPK